VEIFGGDGMGGFFFFRFVRYLVGGGLKIRFWHDV
jgi:hypothetical protein